MATETPIGSMNLERDWPYGSHTWKPGMDRNLLKLAFLTHPSVKSRTTALPVDVEEGAVYIVPENGKFAIGDLGEWKIVDPSPGMWCHVQDSNTFAGYIGDPVAWVTVIDFEAPPPDPQPRAVAFYQPGKAIPSDVCYMLSVRLPLDFAGNFAGSHGYAEAQPTSDVIYKVTKNGVEVGNIIFLSGSQAATFLAPAPINLIEGDILRVIAPAATHGLSNVAVTLKGTTPGV